MCPEIPKICLIYRDSLKESFSQINSRQIKITGIKVKYEADGDIQIVHKKGSGRLRSSTNIAGALIEIIAETYDEFSRKSLCYVAYEAGFSK